MWRYGLPSVCIVIRSALMSPKRAPTARPGRDRFTAESYTVLGMKYTLVTQINRARHVCQFIWDSTLVTGAKKLKLAFERM